MIKLINLALIFTLGTFNSCSIEEAKDTTENSAKVDMADKDIVINKEDTICKKDSDCTIIDSGCCRGEKRAAVNKMRAPQLLSQNKPLCVQLRSEKFQEMIASKQARAKDRKAELKHELCYGRQGIGYRFREEVECKKEETPFKEDETKSEGERAIERCKWKQEQEAKEGTCIIATTR